MPRLPHRCLALACFAGALLAGCGPGGGSTSGPSSAPESATASGAVASVPANPTAAATPVASPDRAPGTARTDVRGVDQVWVPGGVFEMGADAGSAVPPEWAVDEFGSEQPRHEVALSRGYWIDLTEVTVADFAAFKAAGGYDDQSLWSDSGWRWRQPRDLADLPAPCLEQQPEEPQVCVTWYEAQAYAHWRGGRLPTEAEWEFAARGPESRIYPWGDEYDASLANLDGGAAPVAVGSYPDGASWVGALDLAGNAMEWVNDWYSETYYQEGVRDDPLGPERGAIKIEKGGWWGPLGDVGEFVGRASYRHFEDTPSYQDHHIGFRVVSLD